MPQIISPKDKKLPALSFAELCQLLQKTIGSTPSSESQSNKPLVLTFEDPPEALIFYHLEEHTFGYHLLQIEGKSFVCRIKANTKRTVITDNPVSPDSIVFYDATVYCSVPLVSVRKGSSFYRLPGKNYS